MDIIEVNEAFASQSLAVVEELGIDTDKLNIDGGAIALGHPLGASGGRITGKAASLLRREGGKYALATMCIGGGQGIATVLEAVYMGKEGIKMTQADKAEIGRVSQAAVIGAGVMGSGIAAHLANAGVPVLLLDIVPPDADNRNVLAGTALKKLNKAD